MFGMWSCFQILTMLRICFFCHTHLQVTGDSHSRNLMLFLSHEASRSIATNTPSPPPLGWDSHPPQGYPPQYVWGTRLYT